MLAAERALWVAPQFEFAEFEVEGVEEQEAADQREALAQGQLEGLGGLDEADNAGQDAQHAALGATGNQARGRGFGEDAAIAGAAQARGEHAGLALETEDRAIDIGLAQEHAGIVGQVACGEIVGAIHDDVVGPNQVEGILARQAGVVQAHLDVRVEPLEGVPGRVGLGPADVAGAVDDLALEVGKVHRIEIHQAELADARRRKVKGHGRTEPADPDAEHAGRANFLLPLQPDFGQDEVTRVTAEFVIGQFHNRFESGARSSGAFLSIGPDRSHHRISRSAGPGNAERGMKQSSDTQKAAARLERLSGLRPTLAIVLGSGFQHAADRMAVEAEIAQRELPGFAPAGVSGHAGRLLIGRLAGTPVIVLSGRAHFYEGHSMAAVTFAVRALASSGIRDLLLTNAAGGINRRFRPGDFMVLSDHINLMGVNPLRPDSCGLPPGGAAGAFVDLTCVYDPGLRARLLQAGRKCGLKLHSGVYLALCGPSYETPAEIRAFARLGADAVGMSTVPEAVVARQCGMRVAALSCITNLAAGRNPQPLSHDEVLATAERVKVPAASLIEAFARAYEP